MTRFIPSWAGINENDVRYEGSREDRKHRPRRFGVLRKIVRPRTAAVLASVVCAAGVLVTGGAAASGAVSPRLAAITQVQRPSLGALSVSADLDASSSGQAGSFGTARVGSAPVPVPAGVAVDVATDTIYVSSGDNNNGPSLPNPPNTVAVINGQHCQALEVSSCKGPWPTVKVGDLPGYVAIDQATDTVYVTNVGDNTVSVIDGATCNAEVTSGCDRRPATVPVGSGPGGLFADSANHTVYVANFNKNTISMINSSICNSSDLAGCSSQRPPTVHVGQGPGDVDVNEVTHTVYVATLAGLSAFSEDTCNAIVRSGCGRVGQALCTKVDPTCNAGFGVEVDSDNNTIFQADGDSTVTVFDGRTCDASDLAGCAKERPGVVAVAPAEFFEVSIWMAVDAPLHTVYVVNQKDDTVSVIDTNVCNGGHLSACATLRPPTIHTGEDPEAIALNPDTQTLYTANQVTNDVSVIDASTCNATITRGCRDAPPALALSGPGPHEPVLALGDFGLAADSAVSTLYVANFTRGTLSMIDTRSCNAHSQEGCVSTPRTVSVRAFPQGVAVDQNTHTVYVVNEGIGPTGSVSVINATTCNATVTTGCGDVHTLRVPGGDGQAVLSNQPGNLLAVDVATDTIYVITVSHGGPNTVSVFNGATCNASDSSGCTQVPHSVTVGYGGGTSQPPVGLAVDDLTDTVYVTDSSQSNKPDDYTGDTISVIDGASCNAHNTTGCAAAARTITVGPKGTTPDSVALDEETDTVYVADLQQGEGSGTVSVIMGATCNAAVSRGCGQAPQSITVGFGPVGIAFDDASRRAVVTNIEDTSVSVIDAATCNSVVSSSCSVLQPKLPVGRAPLAVAIDPKEGTAYVSNGDDTVSIVPTIP